MTITVGAKHEVAYYLGSANARAFNALDDAIEALQGINGAFNTTAPEANFKDTEKVNVLPIHEFKDTVANIDIPSDPIYSESDIYDVDDVNVNKGSEYFNSPAYINPNNLPDIPTPTIPAQPGDAPEPSIVTLPDVPVLDVIPNPKEYPITIPVKPIISIEDFDKTAPVYKGVDAPVNSFSWQEDPYTSEMLIQTEGVINEMLSGHTGIPDVIWDAIWQRDSDKEDKQAITLLRASRESSANLGFTLPQGAQVARELEVHTTIYNSSNTRSRDIAIKQAEHETENLKNAVVQGLAMENMMSTLYDKSLNRLLDAAKFLSQIHIELYNAHLAGYKIEMEIFALEVEVYKTQLEADIAKMEVYKSEVMAMAEVGKLNQIQVDIFVAKHEALKVKVELYNSELEGVKTIIETDKIKLDGHGINIQAYKTAVDAALSEYEGFKSASQGTAAQAQVLQANSDLFAKRVASVQSDSEQNVAIAELNVKEQSLKLEAIQQNLAKYTADAQKYIAIVEANTKAAQLEVQNKQVEYGRIGASDNTILAEFSARVAKHKDENNTNIVNAQMYLDAVKFLDKQYLDLAMARAGINSDIGNAAMSAVNVHAGITDSASNSFDVA